MLDELGLATVLEQAPLPVAVPPAAGRTALERSAAFRAYAARLADGLAQLERRIARPRGASRPPSPPSAGAGRRRNGAAAAAPPRSDTVSEIAAIPVVVKSGHPT